MRIFKQTSIMIIPVMNRMMLKKQSENAISYLWEEVHYMENKVLFFMNKYLEGLPIVLKKYDPYTERNSVILPLYDNYRMYEVSSYFDAMLEAYEDLANKEQIDNMNKLLHNRLNSNNVYITKRLVIPQRISINHTDIAIPSKTIDNKDFEYLEDGSKVIEDILNSLSRLNTIFLSEIMGKNDMVFNRKNNVIINDKRYFYSLKDVFDENI